MSSLNYMELCRLCLVKDRVQIPIFEGEGDIRQIFLKIAACLPVKVGVDFLWRHDAVFALVCVYVCVTLAVVCASRIVAHSLPTIWRSRISGSPLASVESTSALAVFFGCGRTFFFNHRH